MDERNWPGCLCISPSYVGDVRTQENNLWSLLWQVREHCIPNSNPDSADKILENNQLKGFCLFLNLGNIVVNKNIYQIQSHKYLGSYILHEWLTPTLSL